MRIMHPYPSLRDQFVAHVARVGKCWVWTGYCNQDGHGRIAVKRRLTQATHVAWFLKHGAWPTSQINHTCDNPQCVTIRHLYEGTQKQNMQDKFRRGRASPNLKIFRVGDIDYTMDELAIKAVVTRTCIHYRIKRGLTGRDLIARAFEAPRA